MKAAEFGATHIECAQFRGCEASVCDGTGIGIDLHALFNNPERMHDIE
jgi:hypothetical protein